MDFMAVYAEAGMIGIVGVMFVYLVISLSKKSDAQQEWMVLCQEWMEMVVDSLKVSVGSSGSMVMLFMDLLPYTLGLIIAVMNIVYLYYKIKKTKES